MHTYTVYQLHSLSFTLGLWLRAGTLKADHLSVPLTLQVDYLGLPWDLKADYLNPPTMGYEGSLPGLPWNLRVIYLDLP